MKEEKSLCTCRASGCQSAVAVARRQLAGGVYDVRWINHNNENEKKFVFWRGCEPVVFDEHP
jgi:hypothetical protein